MPSRDCLRSANTPIGILAAPAFEVRFREKTGELRRAASPIVLNESTGAEGRERDWMRSGRERSRLWSCNFLFEFALRMSRMPGDESLLIDDIVIDKTREHFTSSSYY